MFLYICSTSFIHLVLNRSLASFYDIGHTVIGGLIVNRQSMQLNFHFMLLTIYSTGSIRMLTVEVKSGILLLVCILRFLVAAG